MLTQYNLAIRKYNDCLGFHLEQLQPAISGTSQKWSFLAFEIHTCFCNFTRLIKWIAVAVLSSADGAYSSERLFRVSPN